MKAKLITNPYIIYSLGFLFVLLLYPLHWSAWYPDLSFGLICFLSETIIINLLVGLLFHKSNYFTYSKISYSDKKLLLFTIFILLGYVAEFVYMQAVPVYAIITGAEYDYTQFGIPTFHVVLVTFNSFWAIFIFHNLISQRRRKFIILYILCLVPSILIFNRGMFLLIIASCLFVLLMSARKMLKLLFKISLFLLILLFLFGIAGNVRVSGGDTTANDIILDVGDATRKFEKAPVPDEFFWGYLYITSSLGNLQQTINVHSVPKVSLEKVAAYINSEILPDFIAKRNVYLAKRLENIDQIYPAFTVGTVYGRSYAYFSWWGLFAMYAYLFFFTLIVIRILRKRSDYFVSGIAILNCIMLFNIFDNMFIFSGLVLQLAYPILLGALSKIRFGNNSEGKAISV